MKKNASPLKSVLSFTGPKLSEDLVFKVIMLEEKCRKTHSQECIVELVYNYRKLIEHYSNLQDNISLYFTEKMQNLLASQKTIDIIDKTQETLTYSMTACDAMERLSTPQNLKELGQETTKYDMESKRKERSKMVKMFIEIKKTRKRANVANILNAYYQECMGSNTLVGEQMQVQRKNLEERLRVVFDASKKRQREKEQQGKGEKELSNDSTVESIYIS